jgi:hypothetical protein
MNKLIAIMCCLIIVIKAHALTSRDMWIFVGLSTLTSIACIVFAKKTPIVIEKKAYFLKVMPETRGRANSEGIDVFNCDINKLRS